MSSNCELNLESNYQKTFPQCFWCSVKQAVHYQWGSSALLQIQSGFSVFKVSWSHQKYIKHWMKTAKTFKLIPVIVFFPFWTCIFKRIDIYAQGKALLTVNKEAKIFPHQQQSKLCEAFCIIFHHTTINKNTKKWVQFLRTIHSNTEQQICKFCITGIGFLVCLFRNFQYLLYVLTVTIF